MEINDTIYNKHFRLMILQALCCGLNHPVEWIENYDRVIGEKDENINEIEEFCDLTIKELYASMFCINIEKVTMQMCNNWINTYYKQGYPTNE